MRDSGLLVPASCAKKRPATIRFAQPCAAFARPPCECKDGKPWAARSAFRRQRIVALSVCRLDGDGSADVLVHATPPETPCSASVGRFSLGDSGPVLPTVFVPCWSIVTAGPTSPVV